MQFTVRQHWTSPKRLGEICGHLLHNHVVCLLVAVYQGNRGAAGKLPPDGECAAATPSRDLKMHCSEAQRRLGVVEATIKSKGREDRIVGSRRAVVGLELSGQDRTVPERRVAIKEINRTDIQLEVLMYLITDIEVGEWRNGNVILEIDDVTRGAIAVVVFIVGGWSVDFFHQIHGRIAINQVCTEINYVSRARRSQIGNCRHVVKRLPDKLCRRRR